MTRFRWRRLRRWAARPEWAQAAFVIALAITAAALLTGENQ